MKMFLLGEKLGHSLSVPIHTALGLYDYSLHPLPREELADFLIRKGFDGLNVTIPYKKDVIPYLDEISPEASLCGAVNTVAKREGKLYGHNTDLDGMGALLEKAGISLGGKKVLILGSGGTSGTALALCHRSGAARAERVSRSGKDGCISYEEAKKRKDTEIILNTTPCGMFPNMGESPVDVDDFPALEGIADAVYNPLRSALVLAGEKRGIPAMGGLYMLVSQAVFAAEFWTGRDLKDRIDPIYASLLKEKENVVLIGMPGCGKSTVGKALAEALGKEFFDSDEEIVKEAGISIPEIFSREGEGAFRDRESQVIRALSEKQGIVLATGGGAVLRKENVDFLRANGKIVFLDAPLEALASTADRPLSSTPEALKKRYEERYGIYCSAAHVRLPVTRDLKENLIEIKKVLK